MNINPPQLNIFPEIKHYLTPEIKPLTSEAFSQEAYSNQKVEEIEIKTVLEKPRLPVSPPVEKQTNSIFLNSLACEIQWQLFKLLDKNILQNCLLVCKQFNVINTPIFVSKALPAVINDFMWLNSQIDKLATDDSLKKGYLNGKKITIQYSSPSSHFKKVIRNFENINKKISSFQAYCVFLVNNADKDIQEIKYVMKSVLELQKASQFYLNENEKLLLSQ